MTDKSKLEQVVEAITEMVITTPLDEIPDTGYIYETAQQILALCEPEWVPVSERLPITEEMLSGSSYMDREVIICTRDRSVYACLFEAGNTIDLWYGFKGYYENYVTHWMPLPTPPEQDK